MEIQNKTLMQAHQMCLHNSLAIRIVKRYANHLPNMTETENEILYDGSLL